MRKLAIITHEFYPVLSGGTIFVDKIATALSDLGYEIEVFTAGIGRGFLPEEKRGNIIVHRFFTGRTSRGDAKLFEHLLFFLIGCPQIMWYFLFHKFDVMLSVFALPAGLVGLVGQTLFRIPCVIFVDSADLPGIQSAVATTMNRLLPLFKYVTRNVRGVVILDGVQDIAIPLVKNNTVEILPNGTDIPQSSARPGSSPSAPIQFLSIGRIVERKGFREIVEACVLLKKKTKQFHLSIVGYGSDERDLRAMIEQHALQDVITFAGRVEYQDLDKYYRATDCYLFYGYREGSSLAMIEAISYGLPVVAPNHPGNTTYVVDGYNGYLVDHPNINKLFETLLAIVDKRDLLSMFGENSRKLALEYSWRNIAKKYDAVLTSVCD